jgi:hypothetical protein
MSTRNKVPDPSARETRFLLLYFFFSFSISARSPVSFIFAVAKREKKKRGGGTKTPNQTGSSGRHSSRARTVPTTNHQPSSIPPPSREPGTWVLGLGDGVFWVGERRAGETLLYRGPKNQRRGKGGGCGSLEFRLFFSFFLKMR